jgi:FlaA1/EpsC-like NDP-sugar epimerase
MAKRLQYAADLLTLVVAFQAAYLLRFEFAIPRSEVIALVHQLPYVVLLQMTAMSMAGVQTFIWRYIGISELMPFAKAASWSAVVVLLLRILLPESVQPWRVPLSVIVMDTILAFGGVVALRVLRRVVHEYQGRFTGVPVHGVPKTPVLLIGAGRTGVAAAREIQDGGRTALEIRGFVDDDPQKLKSVIHGIRVVGTTDDLPRLVPELQIDHVVISIAEASRQQLKRIHDICDSIPVKVRIVPAMHEILQGTVKFSRIRDVGIEDLLGRDPVQLDEGDIMGLLTGRTVMVTGAGGSIGSELVRQVARFRPSRLLLVERAEFALYTIEREMRANWPDVAIEPLIADVGDEERMRQILAGYRPSAIFHAAAHKHVPMMEHNAGEAIKNNVLATYLLGRLAGEYGIATFVLISTDKAVRPTSVMGASKRLAELVVQTLDVRYSTKYSVVRFGNVIGSAGSVIPLFREQIARGGPVTVTHPEMKRYFMTIPEAAQLVLQAAVIGEGGEIFVLDMGEPVSILEIARDIITLTGLRPFVDINIEFTGLRPGEKLFEELERNGENLARTRHPKIFIGRIAAPPPDVVQTALEGLTVLSRAGHEVALRTFLNQFLQDAEIEVAAPPQLTAAKTGELEPAAGVHDAFAAPRS